MERRSVAPVSGKGVRAAVLIALLTSAGPADAQKYRYRPLPPIVVAASAPGAPLLPYRELPTDDRIAPDDFALDDIAEAPPSAAEQAAIDARLAALRPDQPYTPRPALWRMRDHDTTIWLFGTVHVLPPGFRWRSPAVEALPARADALLVESVDDPGAADPFAAKGDAALPPLATRVNASHRAKLAALVATLPAPAAKLLDTLPTWIAAVAISVARDIRAGELPGPGADDWFEAEFRRRGKPVRGIEDGAQVVAAANAIPDAEARAMVDAALDAPPFDRATARLPLDAWAKGQVGPGSPVMVSLGSPALSDALLTMRNAAWARTLKARLATPGTTVFAAGAGHFIGAGSVLDRLRALGVRVERVE